MANIGQDVEYLDQAEFKAFWDADAKRVEDAVRIDRPGRRVSIFSLPVFGEGRGGGRPAQHV